MRFILTQLQIDQLNYDIITSGSEVSLTEFQGADHELLIGSTLPGTLINWLGYGLITSGWNVNPEEVKGQILTFSVVFNEIHTAKVTRLGT